MFRRAARRLVYRGLPLAFRLRTAALACHWGAARWSLALIGDLAQRDPAEFHAFLWRHHLAAARTFSATRSLDELVPSRRLLVQDILAALRVQALSVDSVLDAGCSSGFLLRHFECALRPAPQFLIGFDLDAAALAAGQAELTARGSRCRLFPGDLRQPPQFNPLTPAHAGFDLVVCAGVLRYFSEAAARTAVSWLMRQTRGLLVLTGPASRGCDNGTLTASQVLPHASFAHNFDAMIAKAQGRIVFRRWQGAQLCGGQTVYFVFARPDQF